MNAKPNQTILEVIEARKRFAKFIGLALFKVGRECLKKFGPNCSVKGPCCEVHRLEGLKEAHELFPQLFEPFGVELDKIDGRSDAFFISLLALYADFKTQIIASDLCLNSERASSRNLENLLEIYFGSSMHVTYLKGKLQARAVQFRAILEQESGDLREALSQKFPADLFESNLKNVLRSVYASFPETFMAELIKNNINDKMTAMTIKTENKREEAPIAKAVQRVKQEQKVEQNPFENVVISGKFFRGILEPVDERFAAIIEGREVNVKQYLAQRRRLALLPGDNNSVSASTNRQSSKKPKSKTTENTANITTSSISKTSLMERHDSAEKISWETQQMSSDEEVIRVTRPEPVATATTTSTVRTVTSSNNEKKVKTGGRRRFSETETRNLIEGIRRFGRDWRRILSTYEFDDRSNVDLKDKARNLEKLGLLQ